MLPLRYGVAQSLDGYIAPPDETTSWITNDPTIDFDALYASFDSFVMGRKTYEIITGGESSNSNNPLRGRHKESVVVISRTLRPEDHPDVTVVAHGHIDYVRRMKGSLSGKISDSSQREGSRGGIWLMGGGRLASDFLAAGLLNGVDTAIIPAVLGAGFKLFDESGFMTAGNGGGEVRRHYPLRLASLERKESGIVMMKYDVLYE